MNSHIAVVRPGMPADLFGPFDNVLRTITVSNATLLGGFAYVTLGGVEEFTSLVEQNPNWSTVKKQFIVGIHHGITEPSALDKLIGLNSCQVRIYIPGKRLTSESLVARPLFHPKVLAIREVDNRGVRFLQAGSANLTYSAISDNPRNYEVSIALRADQGDSVDRDNVFWPWWADLWNQSCDVDSALIKRYANLRIKLLDRNPILRSTAGAPAGIGNAEYFFSEVGAGSGPPGRRHQIEFPEFLARFFGPPVRRRRDITLRSNLQSWPGRPLSYKKTTYGVEIWRLGMPTQHLGGDPIAERVILFRRTNDPEIFEVKVVNTTSNIFRQWVRTANLTGHLGATHGRQRVRQYGYF